MDESRPPFPSPAADAPPVPPVQPGSVPEPPPNSGMAIASLVLGVLGVLTICVGVGAVFGLIALVLGIIAINHTTDPTRRRGRAMAVAGTTLGGVSLVLLPFAAMMIGILLPAFGAARQTARQMQNNTQIRGVHQAMVMHAQGNGHYFPGLDLQGEDKDITVEGRLGVLLDANYVAGDYVISPSEEGLTVWTGGPVTTQNYSYALLEIAGPGGRRDEWKETLNSEAVAISDRNVGTAAAPYSVHTEPSAGPNWRGSVGWNDNHVTFEAGHEVMTRFGAGTINMADHLFEPAGPDDAWMIHSGK